MDFIREKIKEKPINKKKILEKIAIAALCGLVFSLVVFFMMMIFIPIIKEAVAAETDNTEFSSEELMETEATETQEDTEAEIETETETQADVVIPPDLNLSISDYQTLQDELYSIGNEVNKSIVTVAVISDEQMEGTGNPFEADRQGCGLIVHEDTNYLYILTEKKVIADAGDIRVTFIDNTGAAATFLKSDANTGLTILTIEKRQLSIKTKEKVSVAVMGSSYEMTNGSVVIALETNYSILTGNITSVQNEIATRDKNYSIFTTDIVASENAGGVLINTKGEVIGIVMQSLSESQDINTLTAVEADELLDLIPALCNGKDIPYMGLYISTVTKDISKDYDIPLGVYIKEVSSDSPAMKAGLQSGDVIVEMNGSAVSVDAVYSDMLQLLIPGTTCEIVVKRQNGDAYYKVTCMAEIGVLE